jgi:hypothetical protein
MRSGCTVLDWAASGAMALTGMPEETPAISPAPALALLGQVTAEFARVTRETGRQVRADPAELITGRAALAGLTRGGLVSADGSSFLLPAADGWCAVTLSRPDDWAAAPAIAGALALNRGSLAEAGPEEIVTRARARTVLATAALSVPAEDFAAAAQLAGVPAAALPAGSSRPAAAGRNPAKRSWKRTAASCCPACTAARAISRDEDLEFDHIDPSTKAFAISAGLSRAWDALVEEAAKCQLLCKPCHVAKGAEDRPELQHGIYYVYWYWNCRRDPCKAANAAKSAALAAKKQQRWRLAGPTSPA